MVDNNWKQKFFSIPILSLLVAALALLLSAFLAYRDGQLAKMYLALDLQEKRPFLAPIISSKEIGNGGRRKWSWGANNTGSVIARLVYFDLQERNNANGSWKGYS